MMNDTTQAASSALAWLARLEAAAPAVLLRESLPRDGGTTAAALAALAAEALARDRGLLVVTPDDELLPDISNALDMNLRPLCLVLPGADYASRITLRATISLLKNRLARDGDDTQGPAWRAQRARLVERAADWHASLDWCARSGDRDSWPENFGPLFPVRFAPRAVAGSLLAHAADGADWVVLIEPRAHAAPPLAPWTGAAATLLLTGTLTGAAALVPVDERARLAIELELLGQELAELELELATAQAEIGDFTRRYHELVGGRMTELDALQAEVALRRAEAAPDDERQHEAARAARGQAERSREESRHFAGRKREAETADAAEEFRAGADVKKLYRQIAQKIHPDRARDEADRAWRTELMAEANRAYRNADRDALQEILASWQENLHAASARPAGGARSALAMQVMRLRRRVTEIESELNRLHGSRLYELFAAARIARRQGRDLLREMADRLDGQIAAIRAALRAA
ncbi:MAG: J domain-containing protein [Sulfurisoma sp.]|nr:J domain-containing protein [Sulfurisoma sp.]